MAYTKSQLSKMFYKQDKRWADIVTSAIRKKHPLARNVKAFLNNEWSRTFNHWQEMSKRTPITNEAVNELLYFFHNSLYPAAREAGFPDSSFIFPDIELEGAEFRYPVPRFETSGWFDSLRHLLRSKEMKEMAPFIPYGSTALGTIDRLATVVSDAKDGSPAAVQTVKEIKSRSDAGDPQAAKAVEVMKVVSKNQTKGKSFYARGISVGHDPVEIGATRRHSSSSRQAPSGTAARVADHRSGKTVIYYTPPPGGGQNPYTQWGQRAVTPPPVIGPSAPIRTKLPPMPVQPPGGSPYGQPPGADPYGRPMDPFANPYGQYGYPQDPYAMYPPYDPYGFPFAPYGLPGLPPGYGYPESPVIDRGGYQQYDAATDSFFSSNQKQVYDEATGMFYPVNAENPYASFGY